MSHLSIMGGGGGGGKEGISMERRTEIFVTIYFVESQDLSIGTVCGNRTSTRQNYGGIHQ